MNVNYKYLSNILNKMSLNKMTHKAGYVFWFIDENVTIGPQEPTLYFS